jgi:uncharacterized NAD(P)/FAD-binding protein YdhS
MTDRRRVGIVGGGASGTLLAARLLREASHPLQVVVFEPATDLGRGVAYSTGDPLHLLNVPAGGMSALPEHPGHFARWAGVGADDFVPRAAYGRYLREVLAESVALAREGSTFEQVRERVVDLGTEPSPWVATASGRRIWFDVVVLATGHGVPTVPDAIASAGLPSTRLIPDPWSPGALDGVHAGDIVLVVGTGLTAVDVSLSILSGTPATRIHAVSRHGLLPIAHEDPWRPRHDAPAWDVLPAEPRVILEYVRSFGLDWRRGLDSLRPITDDLWQAMDGRTRARFIERLSRYWDVHRHRMAPAVARVFDSLLKAGRIRVHGAQVDSVRRAGTRLTATLSDGEVVIIDRIVLCTGPVASLRSDPLGHRLLETGIVQEGPTGSGYLVDPATGGIIDRTGATHDRLLTIGPPRKGVLWETTAMPEIRVQAAEVAAAILATPMIPTDRKEFHDLAKR